MHPILAILGPTASGKSDTAVRLAETIGGVVINADAMQLYQEAPVLTAMPTHEDMARAPHRLFACRTARHPCTAADWAVMAKETIEKTLADGKTPILVGGTGMYVQTLMEGIANVPDIPENIRVQIRRDAKEHGAPYIHTQLAEHDPVMAEKLHPNDTLRVSRALEVVLTTGQSLSVFQDQRTPYFPPEAFRLFVMTLPREELYARCDQRFEHMLAQGALDEVKYLRTLGLAENSAVMQAVGVKEISAFLDGEWSLEEAKEKAQQATRNYAKRQLTWLRGQFPDATEIAFPADPLPKTLLDAAHRQS